MYDLILVRYGEIALKGQNRPFFIEKLINNIKQNCQDLGKFQVEKKRGRIFIQPENKFKQYLDRLQKLPGIVSLSPVIKTDLDLETAKKKGLKLIKRELQTQNNITTFRVTTNRANKDFPGTSPDISREIGAHVLENLSGLEVDLETPDCKLELDIRSNHIYLFTENISGPGGLPVGTSGKGLLLLSGGIDSPVAGWMALKRGMELEALHFHTPPYTSDRSRQKVIDLAKKMAERTGQFKLHLFHFTEIQRAIKKHCTEKFIITIMRRLMYRLACKIASKNQAQVLVTGESIGQVSSQTLENITAIDQVADLPVLRPLIGLNKQEIINLGRQLGTYNISTRPHEDCCTLFVPNHPATKPNIKEIKENENHLNLSSLLNEFEDNLETLTF